MKYLLIIFFLFRDCRNLDSFGRSFVLESNMTRVGLNSIRLWVRETTELLVQTPAYIRFLDPLEVSRNLKGLVYGSFPYGKKGSSNYRFKSAFKMEFVFNSVRHKEVGGKGGLIIVGLGVMTM